MVSTLGQRLQRKKVLRKRKALAQRRTQGIKKGRGGSFGKKCSWNPPHSRSTEEIHGKGISVPKSVGSRRAEGGEDHMR